MFDCIIIGAGPAGITAAIYAARKKMNFLVISKGFGGQASWSFCVDNYPGISGLSGVELMKKFREHLEYFNIEVKEEEVKKIKKIGNGFEVFTDESSYQTKTIIIASGKNPRFLNVPGEEKFKGRGVAYCAVCDSPYFKDKDVAIVGGGNSGLDAVFHLENYAKKIYIIELQEKLLGDPLLIDRIKKIEKVEILTGTKILEINGDKTVENIEIEEKGRRRKLNVQGVFVEIGQIPNTEFVKDFIKLNECGEIVIDKNNMTNVPGIFAAGDVTDIKNKQIVVACGEGSKALLSVWDYLQKCE